MEENWADLLRLKRLEQEPAEEYVTVTMPKSSYRAFYCMADYPVIGRLERDEQAMGRGNGTKSCTRFRQNTSAGRRRPAGRSWAA